MAGAERKITVTFDGKDVGLKKASDDAEGSIKKLGSSASDLGGKLALGLGAGAAGAVAGLGLLAKGAAEDEAAQVRLAQAQRNLLHASDAQIEATEQQITKWEMATGVADDDLRPALQNLIAATHDGRKAQDLMGVALDIAAAKNISATQASEALAGASRGKTKALEAMGVVTKDAAGKTLSFDKIMQNAAATFKGQAAAGAETTAGKFRILKLQLAEMGEDVGSKLLPMLSAGATKLTQWAPKAQAIAYQLADKMKPAVQAVASWVGDHLVPAVASVIGFFAHLGQELAQHRGVLIAVGAAIGGVLVLALGAWAISATAAAVATIAAMAPVIAIGAAIGLLAAGVIYAYTHWGWFHTAVQAVASFLKDTAWPVIKEGAEWVAHFAGVVIDAIPGIARFAGEVIGWFVRIGVQVGETVAGVVRFFLDLPNKIRDTAVAIFAAAEHIGSQVLNGIKSGISSVAGFVGDLASAVGGAIKGVINGVIAQLNDAIPDSLGVGSFSIGLPHNPIPKLADGDIVTRPTLALIGEAGPEAVVPLGRGGAGQQVTLVIDSAGSQLDDLLVQVLRKAITNRGGVNAVFG